jgi:hypothetical protein
MSAVPSPPRVHTPSSLQLLARTHFTLNVGLVLTGHFARYHVARTQLFHESADLSWLLV